MLLRILASLLGLSAIFAGYEYVRANNAVNALSALKASYATAAASALTHAQAITAADTKALQVQGKTAVSSAATITKAAQVYYKTIYLPSIQKLDPTDEANKCASMPVPASILDGLHSPGG